MGVESHHLSPAPPFTPPPSPIPAKHRNGLYILKQIKIGHILAFCLCTHSHWRQPTVVGLHLLTLPSELSNNAFCVCIHASNPFTPESDQFQISPAASPEKSHHTEWGTWLNFHSLLIRWKIILLLVLTTSHILSLRMYLLNLGVNWFNCFSLRLTPYLVAIDYVLTCLSTWLNSAVHSSTQMLNDHLLLRIGGGWDTLEHYLMTHAPKPGQCDLTK